MDILAISVAPWLAFYLRDPRFLGPTLINQGVTYGVISIVVGLVILAWSGLGSIICRHLSMADHKRILLTAFSCASITSMTAFAVTRLDTIPRTLPIIHFFILGSLLIASRLVQGQGPRAFIDRRTRRRKNDQSIIVVGANPMAGFYVRLVDECASEHQRILAVVDPNPNLRHQTLCGHRVIGTPEDLPAIVHEYKTHGIEIRKIVVAIEESQLSASALAALRHVEAEQNVISEFLTERLGLNMHSENASNSAVADKDESAGGTLGRSSDAYWHVKRIVGIVVAGTLLIILAPLLGLIALAVRLGIGSPVIFWQRRIGRLGAGILILKFRTMDAPFDKQGRLRKEAVGFRPVGAFLRRTRLDELPQLLNILRGEMSLIGPRPLLPVDQPLDSSNRLLVLPGITGWAQVHGGSLLAPEEKKALDEYYIRNASLWLDLVILFKTAIILFVGDRDTGEGRPRRIRQARRALANP